MTYDLGGGSRTRSSNRKRPSPARLSLASLSLLVFCLALGSTPAVRAQSWTHYSSRKVIRTQQPDYPAILKNAGIGGVVRLAAKVLANGTVANIQVLGGNPILAESAVKAVMTWKYAPAASPSNEIVTFNFNTH